MMHTEIPVTGPDFAAMPRQQVAIAMALLLGQAAAAMRALGMTREDAVARAGDMLAAAWPTQ